MTELQILRNAKACIEYLANGKDPLTKNPIPENETVRKSGIIKYLNYVANQLEQDILTKEQIQNQFAISEERIARFRAENKPVTITQLAGIINTSLQLGENGFIPGDAISQWLESQELLERYITESGSSFRRVATEKAITYGMENIFYQNGNFKTVIYHPQAQKWIFDSIREIAAFCEKHAEKFPCPQKLDIPIKPFSECPRVDPVIKKKTITEFQLTQQQKDSLCPFAASAKVSQITDYLNSFVNPSQVKKLKNGMITNWLFSERLLKKANYGNGFLPTTEGQTIGIIIQNYERNGFQHQMPIYTDKAQAYIFQNIDDLIEFNLLES